MPIFDLLAKIRSSPSTTSVSVILEKVLEDQESTRDNRERWLRQFWQETWDAFLRCEYRGPDPSPYAFHQSLTRHGGHDHDIDHDDIDIVVVDPGQVCLIRHPTYRRLWDRHFDNKRIERDIGLNRFADALAVRAALGPGLYDALVRDCMTTLNGREVAWHPCCCSRLCSACRSGSRPTARIQVVPFPFLVRLHFRCRRHKLTELSVDDADSIEQLQDLLVQCRSQSGSTSTSTVADAALHRLNQEAYDCHEMGIQSLPLSFHTEIYHQHGISRDQLRSFFYERRHTCPLYDHIFNEEKSVSDHPIQQLLVVMERLQSSSDSCLLWWKFWYEVHRLRICSNPIAIDPIELDSIAFMSGQISSMTQLHQHLHDRGISEPSRLLRRLPVELLLNRTSWTRRSSLLFYDNRTYPVI